MGKYQKWQPNHQPEIDIHFISMNYIPLDHKKEWINPWLIPIPILSVRKTSPIPESPMVSLPISGQICKGQTQPKKQFISCKNCLSGEVRWKIAQFPPPPNFCTFLLTPFSGPARISEHHRRQPTRWRSWNPCAERLLRWPVKTHNPGKMLMDFSPKSWEKPKLCVLYIYT